MCRVIVGLIPGRSIKEIVKDDDRAAWVRYESSTIGLGLLPFYPDALPHHPSAVLGTNNPDECNWASYFAWQERPVLFAVRLRTVEDLIGDHHRHAAQVEPQAHFVVRAAESRAKEVWRTLKGMLSPLQASVVTSDKPEVFPRESGGVMYYVVTHISSLADAEEELRHIRERPGVCQAFSFVEQTAA